MLFILLLRSIAKNLANANFGSCYFSRSQKSHWARTLCTNFFYTIFSGHRFLNILSELSRLEPHYLITTSMWNCVELTLNYLVLNSLLSFSLKLLRSIICINFTKRFNFDVTGNSSMIQVKFCTKYRKP